MCDRALRRGGPRIAALRRIMAACAVLNVLFASIPWIVNVWGMLGAMFVAAGFVVLAVAYAIHVYAPDHAGLIAGVGAGS